jgi:hypothetical protein
VSPHAPPSDEIQYAIRVEKQVTHGPSMLGTWQALGRRQPLVSFDPPGVLKATIEYAHGYGAIHKRRRDSHLYDCS